MLTYESFTAFALEASFFGVLIFGRTRVSPAVYLFSTAMVALGTTFSAFWIMVNNSWMQAPVGYAIDNGVFLPTDWAAIIFSPVVWVRFPHMLAAAYLTGAFCVAATGAWYRIRGTYAAEGMLMLRMGLFLAALLIPVQLFLGHLNGDYVHDRQPSKFAAIEARWHDEQPASEVIIAIPDAAAEKNYLELKIPYLGSLIASMRLDSKEVGLTSFAKIDRPPVAIPFFAFRVMVGCGLLMMALAWLGSFHLLRERKRGQRLLLWATFFSFPAAVHCYIDRLVYRRGGSSALERLRLNAHGGRRFSEPDHPGSDGLAAHLRSYLRDDIRLRHALCVSPPEGRPRRNGVRA